MPWWDDNNVPFDNAAENYFFENLVDGSNAVEDEFLQELFDTALFNFDISLEERNTARELLEEHLANQYGINFKDAFDWEGYAAYYDAA